MQNSLGRTIVLTVLALVAFAANSVLARLALASGGIDTLSFTGVRLISGAIVLLVASAWVGRHSVLSVARAGSWSQATALFIYAITASLSYALLGAGIGALILFGTVQLTTITRAILLGERPGPLVWFGLAIAFGSLIYLVSPSLSAPDPLGVVLSVASGLGWAAYSLSGHYSASPLLDSGGNFLRTLPIALVLAMAGLALHTATPSALWVAVLCGAVSTGMGYATWYAVLPSLRRMQASIAQLTVPAIAALGAVPVVGEPLTPRFAISAAITIGGVALAILARHRIKKAA